MDGMKGRWRENVGDRGTMEEWIISRDYVIFQKMKHNKKLFLLFMLISFSKLVIFENIPVSYAILYEGNIQN